MKINPPATHRGETAPQSPKKPVPVNIPEIEDQYSQTGEELIARYGLDPKALRAVVTEQLKTRVFQNYYERAKISIGICIGLGIGQEWKLRKIIPEIHDSIDPETVTKVLKQYTGRDTSIRLWYKDPIRGYMLLEAD